ncbi:MAG TPA: hypothetical protein VMX17_07115 [Candidatus Glassbacteria bacterium]|nr:hypothetical protein [Candidatus Glassbacteria bacterium]
MKDSVRKSLLRQTLGNARHEREFITMSLKKGLIDNVADGIEYLKKHPLKNIDKNKT